MRGNSNVGSIGVNAIVALETFGLWGVKFADIRGLTQGGEASVCRNTGASSAFSVAWLAPQIPALYDGPIGNSSVPTPKALRLRLSDGFTKEVVAGVAAVGCEEGKVS